MSRSTLIRGGTVADAGDRRADVLVIDGRIAAVGPDLDTSADEVVDAGGRIVLPGAVDAHSHADARVLDDDVQLALLRQGVTTVVVGQDGVSFAPDATGFSTDYFGPLNGGRAPGGPSVAELLAAYGGATRLGVGYLVPAGNVRYEVMGTADRPATPDELDRMAGLVADGLDAGALGLSSGLDYVPGCFADADELAALCRPVAAVNGLYVSHMRGYEEESRRGFTEFAEICRAAGVRGHVSHFHAREALVAELLTEAAEAAADVSFDAYPYFRGCTLLSMVVLPKDIVAEGRTTAAGRLADEDVRRRIRHEWQERWMREGIDEQTWAARVQIASAGSPAWEHSEGKTLAAVAAGSSRSPVDVALDMLTASRLGSTVVIEVPKVRDDDELARQFALPGATVGSDGIYQGAAPHPRAWGCFARMYARFVVDRGDFTWSQMAEIVAGRAARRYGLGDRGRIAVGHRADLALADPSRLRDHAWYDSPRDLATGIDEVWVAGVSVLSGGSLTDALPGGVARRAAVPS